MWLRCNVAVDLYAIAVDLQLYPDARSSSYSCEISGAVALIKSASGDLQRKKSAAKSIVVQLHYSCATVVSGY